MSQHISEAFWDFSLPSGTRPYVPEPLSTYRNQSPHVHAPLCPFPDCKGNTPHVVPLHIPQVSIPIPTRSRSRLRLRSRRDTHLCSFPLFLLFLPCCSIPSMTSFHVILLVPYTWHLVYIGLYLQRDPHPFLFGSPARFVTSCIRLLLP